MEARKDHCILSINLNHSRRKTRGCNIIPIALPRGWQIKRYHQTKQESEFTIEVHNRQTHDRLLANASTL